MPLGRPQALAADGQRLTYRLTIDPYVQQAYLKASNTGASDQFWRRRRRFGGHGGGGGRSTKPAAPCMIPTQDALEPRLAGILAARYPESSCGSCCASSPSLAPSARWLLPSTNTAWRICAFPSIVSISFLPYS